MKKNRHSYFKSVRSLALFIEKGNAVIHRKSRDISGSLRELPNNIEEELAMYVPYTELEAAKDYIRDKKEAEKAHDEDDDPEMERLFVSGYREEIE